MRVSTRTIKACLKISLAQLYVATIGRKHLKDDIWIIGEKKTEARDNGYHFFKYLRCEHPEINSFYVIKKGSPDQSKVEELGPVIEYDSFRHCIFYVAAKIRACSQIHGVLPYEDVPGIRHLRLFMRKDQRHINLKHGITKDFRPNAFDYRIAGYDLYISGAKAEYEEIKKTYDYPEKNIALTGFCRFDALHNLPKTEKTILIMPTFRDWLRTSDSSKTMANAEEMKAFKDSPFFKNYIELLSCPRMLTMVRNNGYRILFYLHYTFQPYISAFDFLQNDIVTICNRKEYDVQQLLTSSSMLITDYSSVFFDYGYMMKAMAFFQFDLKEYREKHYQEGYFSYERDAFGPVFDNMKDLVDYIDSRLKEGLKIESKYMSRVKTFFIPYDNRNCQRVYDAILKLDED